MSKPKSEVKICDRCGKYYEASKYDNYGYAIYYDNENKMDFCDSCYNIIEKILTNDITRDVENRIRECNF